MKLKNLRFTTAILGMMTILTGCGEKEYVLQETILAKTFIANVDGDYTILKLTSKNAGHNHYKNVMNGEILTDNQKCNEAGNLVRIVNEIELVGTIESMLTKDELERAINGNLTSEDIINIIDRINQEYNQELELQEKTKIYN